MDIEELSFVQGARAVLLRRQTWLNLQLGRNGIKTLHRIALVVCFCCCALARIAWSILAEGQAAENLCGARGHLFGHIALEVELWEFEANS